MSDQETNREPCPRQHSHPRAANSILSQKPENGCDELKRKSKGDECEPNGGVLVGRDPSQLETGKRDRRRRQTQKAQWQRAANRSFIFS